MLISLHEASKSGLEQLGATKIRKLGFRDGYVFVGQRTDGDHGRLVLEEVRKTHASQSIPL